MKRFGTEYGGFYYPENLEGLDKSSIIYCIGAGEDISHDIEIANKLNSNIYIIDPTPRAIKHYKYVKNILEGKNKIIYDKKFGGGNPYEYWKIILENKIDTDKIIYNNCGIGTEDSIQKFYLPSNKEYVSCSLVKGMKGEKYINVNIKKLRSIMNEYGHNKIDLLKMDIEGSECDVIEDMLKEEIYPKYLAVEFDLGFNGENIKDIEKCNKTIENLYKNNYELIFKNHSDFTFYYKNFEKKSKKIITDIYSIGYRCNTDDLMKKLNIRHYSSPFSYMVIDYKSVFKFIYNNFKDFFDIIYLNNKEKNNKIYELSNQKFYNYNWYNTFWYNDLYINKSCLVNKYIQNVPDWENVCIWNHHNINNLEIKEKINRRIKRLYNSLNNKSKTTLLIYINKIEKNINYDKTELFNFIKNKKCNLLFIQPLYNYNKEIEHIYTDNNLNIIHMNSYYECNGTGLDDTRIVWKKLEELIYKIYEFKIPTQKKILFLLNNPGGPDKARYQHTLVSLGEGLDKLNIKYDSNINYYEKSDGKYLFNKMENIDYNKYDYIFTSPCSHYLKEYNYEENDNIFITKKFLNNKNRKYKLIMIDWSDGFFEFNEYLEYYDFYFKSSFQSHILPDISNNIYPLVFNGTNRIINATKNNKNNWNMRTINLLYSHRVSHEVRGYMLELYKTYENFVTFYDDKFEEPNKTDNYYIDWCQTGRRHNPKFYEILKKSKIVDCTGGFVRNINNKKVLCQIDSFKLWEAFFAGCCIIMMDLDLFNIKFPIQPKNMIHYIGITLNKEKDKKILENIRNGEIDIEKIAKNGYEFVKKNYSPEGLTKYILETINYN